MLKLRQLRTILHTQGFEKRRGRGSHEIWIDPSHPKHRVVLSGKNGDDALRYQVSRVRSFRRGTVVYRNHSF